MVASQRVRGRALVDALRPDGERRGPGSLNFEIVATSVALDASLVCFYAIRNPRLRLIGSERGREAYYQLLELSNVCFLNGDNEPLPMLPSRFSSPMAEFS